LENARKHRWKTGEALYLVNCAVFPCQTSLLCLLQCLHPPMGVVLDCLCAVSAVSRLVHRCHLLGEELRGALAAFFLVTFVVPRCLHSWRNHVCRSQIEDGWEGGRMWGGLRRKERQQRGESNVQGEGVKMKGFDKVLPSESTAASRTATERNINAFRFILKVNPVCSPSQFPPDTGCYRSPLEIKSCGSTVPAECNSGSSPRSTVRSCLCKTCCLTSP